MHGRFVSGLVLLALLLVPGSLRAAGLTLDDVVGLHRAGFSDAEIGKEIERSGVSFKVGDAEARKLREAGLGAEFIRKLKIVGAPRLTLAEVLRRHQAGESAAGIIARIGEVETPPEMSPTQAIELVRAKVPATVVRALRGGALSHREILSFAKTGEIGVLLTTLGAGYTPTAQQGLELIRAGLPSDLVRRLRAGELAPRGVAGIYEHPAHRFRVEYPPSWKRMISASKEEFTLEYLFTPETATEDPRKVLTAFSVTPIPAGADTPFGVLPLMEVCRRLQPVIRAEEPGLELRPGTEIVSGQLDGLPAAFFELEGTIEEKGNTPLRMNVGVTRKDGWLYLVAGYAPVDRFDGVRNSLDRCADTLRIGPPPVKAPTALLTGQGWVEKYKEAVVQVVVDWGNVTSIGTGWIVREDGYVLTNQHVVEYQGKIAKEVTLVWDTSLARRSVKATVVDTYKGGAKMGGGALRNMDLYGTDIALLKIDTPGNWLAMPVAPTSSIRLSDPVITMGFPQSFKFGGSERLSMFVTRGVVTRMNKDKLGKLVGMFIDAKIEKGNSGGPCIDLARGAAIGLNTWGYGLGAGEAPPEVLAELNALAGYNGVVPIDRCMELWPEVFDLKAGADQDWTAADHFALAVEYSGQEAFGAAARQLAKVVAMDPTHADAYVLYAAIAARQGDLEAFLERSDNALRINPTHYQALVLRAQVHGVRGEYALASKFVDRAIAARPDSPSPYLARGELMMAVKRYDDALRDADLAAKASHGLLPDPQLLAGEVNYAMGKLEEGRARFRKALEIVPGYYEAMMGEGRYFELKKMWEAALLEYGRVQDRMPHSPGPAEASGRCLLEMNQPEKAFRSYESAARSYRDQGGQPPEAVFQALADIAFDIAGDNKLALTVLTDYANTYLESAAAHLRLAKLQTALGKNPGIAYGHAVLAGMVAEGDPDVLRAANSIRPARLQIEDVLAMAKQDYGSVAVVVSMFAPLGFTLDAEKVKQARDKLNPLVLQCFSVILERQKKGDTGGGSLPALGQGGGGTAGTAPAPSPTPGAGGAGGGGRDILANDTFQLGDGSLSVGFAGFKAVPEAVQRMQRSGQAFVRFIGAHEQSGTALTVYAFDASVRDVDAAMRVISQVAAANGAKVEERGRQQGNAGGVPGSLVSARLTAPAGEFALEVVLAPTRRGVRGVGLMCPVQVLEQNRRVRSAVFETLRIVDAGGAVPAPGGGETRPVPPPAGGDTPPPADPGRPRPEPGPGDIGPPEAEDVPAAPEGRGGGDVPLPADMRRFKEAGYSLTYPDSFVPNAERLALVRNSGTTWVRQVLESRRLMAELMVLGFDRNTTTAAQAMRQVQQFARLNGVQIQTGQTRQVPFGNAQASHVTGILRSTQQSIPFEMLLVPTPSGVRGVYLGSLQGDPRRLGGVRDQVFGGLWIRGISGTPRTGGGVPAGGNIPFRDPAGTMQFSYPRSFQASPQALSNLRQNGVDSIRLIAFERDTGASIFAFDFTRATNVAQALQEFQRVQTGGGGQFKSTGQKQIRVGQQSGTLVSGTLLLQDGTALRWEGIFVPTRTGVRAVTFFAVERYWLGVEQARRGVFDSFRVLK